MENPTRRRVLAAGLTDRLGLLGGAPHRRAHPPAEAPSATLPGAAHARGHRLLNFAEHRAGLVTCTRRRSTPASRTTSTCSSAQPPWLRRHRQGHPRHARPEAAATRSCTTSWAAFEVTDVEALAEAAYDLESTLVATHIELLGQLEGTDGGRPIASILIVEARQAAVLADAAGKGGDFDALFDDTATADSPPSGG